MESSIHNNHNVSSSITSNKSKHRNMHITNHQLESMNIKHEDIIENDHDDHHNQPPKKKQKKLNFSIESIMRPIKQICNSPPLRSYNVHDDSDHGEDDDDDYNDDGRSSTPISPGVNPSCDIGSSFGGPNSFISESSDSIDGGNCSSDERFKIKKNPSSPAPQTSSTSSNNWIGNSKETRQINNNNTTSHSLKQQPTTTVCQQDSRLASAECLLDNKDMWDKFHSLNTEMIITKTGRRMFPVMKVQFQNLNPNARYSVAMDIVPVDNKRYRYAYHKSCWQVAGKADPSAETRLYMHPDSPFNGDLLSRQVVSFEKVKLTNNEMDKSGHIILNSMHKYQPRVYLIELKTPPPTQTTTQQQQLLAQQQKHLQTSTSKTSSYYNPNSNHYHQHNQQQQPQLQSDIEGYRTFVFPETVFTAVTAYQNQLITKMKIDKNPFAKGFRDSSRLSDLDRSDSYDYIASLGPRFISASSGQGGQPGGVAGVLLDGVAGTGPSGSHMDQFNQLLANNPWYSAAAVAAAAGGGNPFNPIGAAACSTAQAANHNWAQLWLAAFSAACLNGSTTPVTNPNPPPTSQSQPPPLQNSLAQSSTNQLGSGGGGITGITHLDQQSHT